MSGAYLEDGGDRAIVWNRAEKRGALSPDFYAAINDAMELAAEPRIRAILLTGQGPFFCAGGDLNVLIDRRTLTQTDRAARIDDLHDLVRGLRASPVPVIAAVEGGAAGAGLSLVLAADMIVAAEGAMFTAAYVKAGLVPDAGLTAALARAVPRQLAMEMCLMARPVSAEDMAALGLVRALAAPGSATAEAQNLIDRIATGPRAAQSAIRKLVAEAYETTEASQLDAERDAMAAAAGGDEAAEGIAAFLEKRSPRF